MELVSFLPDPISAAAVATFQRTLRYAPAWLLLLGLPITVWYGTRFFVVLESALCVVFRRRQRHFLAQNRVNQRAIKSTHDLEHILRVYQHRGFSNRLRKRGCV